jgi:hypothetical protein
MNNPENEESEDRVEVEMPDKDIATVVENFGTDL